jgi:hypothetical protein
MLFQDLLLYIVSSLVFSSIMNSLMTQLLIYFDSAAQSVSVLVGFSSTGPQDTEVHSLEVSCHTSSTRTIVGA